jgi:two-component system sensor histidine kinase BaeS
MAAIAVGVLVFTGVATVSLARRSAVTAARDDLRDRAPEIATQVDRLARLLRARRNATNTRVPVLRELLATTLRISGAGVVTIADDGTITPGLPGLGSQRDSSETVALPGGLTNADLDVKVLLGQEEQSGRVDRYVFIAQPFEPVTGGTPVLVLAQKIETNPTGRAGGFFLIAALIAIGVTVVVSFFLARRLSRPLAAMDETARRIADGDLGARVQDLGGHPADEIAALAETLNTMAGQLEHARGLERAFILSVSHDLRTPLTSIKGYAEALTDGTLGEVPEDRQRAAQVIAGEARRLERLVNDLLTLARLDAHQFSLSPTAIDAADTVTVCVDGFRPAAADLGVSLDVQGPGTVPAVADPERLGQIVANLVENALKYARGAITVTLVPYGSGDLDVRVQDDGPGIDPEERGRVFDRLFVSRTVAGRSVGTGLGLAIVHELAVAMGGRAWVDPAVTTGAAFVVRLPILDTAATPT